MYFDVTVDHVIGKLVEFHLRALRSFVVIPLHQQQPNAGWPNLLQAVFDHRDRLLLLSATTKDTKSAKESENKTLDSVFEPGVVEVDEEPDLDVCQFHVGQQLGLVNSFDHLNTLELND